MTATAENRDASGVRRPVSKDTPDRTDTFDYMSGVRCPESVRNGQTGQTGPACI